MDLDNTLIYSYKHDIGSAKRCVERYQGREISYITEKTFTLLNEVKNAVCIVPTTTRTVEQYERIDLGIGALPYALACNGGVLLVDGNEDDLWYQQSLELVSDCAQELANGAKLLRQDKHRCFEVRIIRGLFVFTKSEKPLESVDYLRKKLDTSLVDVFCNGVKVYIVPKKLNKGNAVQRLQKKLKADYLIAAGDSEFDIPMLLSVQLALAPEALRACEEFKEIRKDVSIRFMQGGSVFSEELLTYILDNCRKGY